jgi:GT2 family glycosyltransferase
VEQELPDLSIVVVTYNGREMALQTLRSASAALGAISVEWLIVDNGSHDGVADAIEHEFPEMHVLRSHNSGFAGGNNVALRKARGRYLLLLNPDITVEEGTFEDLVRALDASPEVGAASVVQLTAEGRLQPSIRRDMRPLRTFGQALFAYHWPIFRSLQEMELREDVYERPRDADWLVGAFLAVRREAFEEVGPLDKRFFMYAEEVDWCRRIRGAGWVVRHLPVMRVTHYGSERPSAQLTAQLSYSKLLYARKHYGPVGQAGELAMVVLGHALRIALFGVFARRRAESRGRVSREALALKVSLGLAPPPFDRPRDERVALR